jgi:uncharacterized membrane protein YkvA (DUF1232 family)
VLEKLKQQVRQLKKEVYVIYLVYSHAGVSWYKKLFLLLIIAYALSPIDLIPDFIPVFGLLDDLVLIPLGVMLAMKMIPSNIWDGCRLKADEFIDIDKRYGLYGAGIIIVFWLILAAWAYRNLLGIFIK